MKLPYMYGSITINFIIDFLKMCLFFGCTGSSLLRAGYSLVVVHKFLILVASLIAEHRL